MVTPLEHPKKEVRKALKQARASGWSVIKAKGRASHTWGTLVCPVGTCRMRLYGTPRVPEDLARVIRSIVAKCRCTERREDRT